MNCIWILGLECTASLGKPNLVFSGVLKPGGRSHMRFFLRAMVQPVWANIPWDIISDTSLRFGNGQGRDGAMPKSHRRETHLQGSVPAWNKLHCISCSTTMDFHVGWGVFCCLPSSYSFSYLYLLLLVKGYPSFISLKRYLLCRCNFWIWRTFSS